MQQVREKYPVTERQAWRILGQSRTTQRYQPILRDDEAPLTASVIPPGWPVWPLRLSSGHGTARCGGLARQPQAGRAHLAARGAEGTDEAAEAGQTMAQRRVVHPSRAALAEPCLGL